MDVLVDGLRSLCGPKETEELEREQAGLQSQVDKLQEERHKLELMLVSHTSECRLLCDDQPQAPSATPPPMTTLPSEASPHPHSPPRVKQEPAEEMQAYSLQHKHSTDGSPYHHNRHAGEDCPSVVSAAPAWLTAAQARSWISPAP